MTIFISIILVAILIVSILHFLVSICSFICLDALSKDVRRKR